MDLKSLKIIFMGTPEFSVPILNALIKNYQVSAVVTQPDKKVGRKQVLTPSPIKKLAEENKIVVLQPAKLKDNTEFLEIVKNLKPDLIVVAAYGFILLKDLLTIPSYGVINAHASLLPKYRGASPIQSVILNGEKESGITIMQINEKMDEGDILAQDNVKISENETYTSLHDKLSILGADLLLKTIPKWLNNEIKPQKQDNARASYCKLLTKENGKIDWHKSASEIERQVRAFNPWPGTWTIWGKKKLKVIKSRVYKVNAVYKVGEVFKITNGIAIACGQDTLEILELQLEGKKPMTVNEFLNGYQKIIGKILK